MSQENPYSLENNLNVIENDDYDLNKIFDSIRRNKKVIGSITGVSILASGLIAFSQKLIWQGEFQIVLSQKQKSEAKNMASSVLKDSLLLSSLDLGQNKEIKTDIEVLKSPSILMPVYEYVRNNKKQNWKYSQSWRFKSWRDKNFKFNLKKGTSVLNITFRDDDKAIIIPVLNKISKSYQLYSGRDRMRDVDNGINYLNREIELYKIKTKKILEQTREFASKYDLIFNPNLGGGNKEMLNNISTKDIESIRVKFANQIRQIEKLLERIDLIYDEDPLNLLYIRTNLNPNNEETPSSLKETILSLNNDLEILRTKYTEKDASIKRISKRRSILLGKLKEEIITSLNSTKYSLEAKVEASSRPKGIILKFKELVSETIRNELVLNNLQARKIQLELEKNREKVPWELITNPTLFEIPVGPSKKLILLSGTLGGLLLGIVSSLILDKKRNIIYRIKDMEKLLNFPLLEDFCEIDEKQWDSSINLILNGLLLKFNKKKIMFISSQKISSKKFDIFRKKINNILNKDKITFTDDLLKVNNESINIFAASVGKIEKKEVEDLNKKITLLDLNLDGWINI